MYMQKLKIRSFEKGLLFQDGEYKKILDQGQHWFFDPLGKTRVDVVSMRKPWLTHDDLDLIVSSGQPGDEALVYELTDPQRGQVWVDNLFQTIIGKGLHALWHGFRQLPPESWQTTRH